jgi:hypothetical protein
LINSLVMKFIIADLNVIGFKTFVST